MLPSGSKCIVRGAGGNAVAHNGSARWIENAIGLTGSFYYSWPNDCCTPTWSNGIAGVDYWLDR